MNDIIAEHADLLQSSSAGAVADGDFTAECLLAHNVYRARHGCGPLILSAKLTAEAQAWAENLAYLGYLKHCPNAPGNFGENVALKLALGSREYTGHQAAAQWYSEVELYDFSEVENQSRCGHFSQLVWKSTREAGFGKAVSPDGKMFAVGRYLPPGNKMNAWVLNVPPPVSGKVEVPTYQDIMGTDQERATVKVITSSRSLPEDSNPASVLLDKAKRQYGDFVELLPRPREALDKQIGKTTKVRVLNGEKSLILILTFMRPDASRYQLSKQVPILDHDENGDVGTRSPSNRRGTGNSVSSNKADDSLDSFATEMLLAHNKLRSRHGAPTLTRSESLENLAQTWSERLAKEGRLRNCDFPDAEELGQSHARLPVANSNSRHSGGTNPGPAAALAKQWYREKAGFQPGDGEEESGLFINGGHFTQMVWRSTEQLGVGCSRDDATGEIFAVCFYRPSGNIAGRFADNVKLFNENLV